MFLIKIDFFIRFLKPQFKYLMLKTDKVVSFFNKLFLKIYTTENFMKDITITVINYLQICDNNNFHGKEFFYYFICDQDDANLLESF